MPLDPVSTGDPHAPAHNEERDAINDLEERLDRKIELPSGAQTGDLLRWNGEAWETTETRFFEGEGRPDGNFAAPIGSRYIDKIAEYGAVEWVKRSGGDGNTGWQCLAGDTGWRNIPAIIDRGNGTIHYARVRRVNGMVSMGMELTMPSNKGTTWLLFGSLPGFGPGVSLYGAMQDNNETATARGTIVNNYGGFQIYNVVGGKRDAFYGSWVTSDPWPTPLPGTA